MSNCIKVIIVEDEEPALRELKFLLEEIGDVEISGCASNGIDALKLIEEQDPDAVFLDIQIPDMDGISVAENMRKKGLSSMIIFATAYDEYAIKAFELNSIDYILKPYNEERIRKTIERIKDSSCRRQDILGRIDRLLKSYDHNNENKIHFSKIPCEYREKTVFVEKDDIIFFTTDSDLIYAKTANKKYITHYTLSELESKGNFIRVHRSYLVNINKIKEIFSWFHGTYKIVMQDDEKTEIPVSRNHIKKLKNELGL